MNDAKITEEQRLLASLGLCVRSGRVILGVPLICEAVRRGGKNAPLLVLEAENTSDNTHKRLTDKCSYYGVECVRLTVDGERLAQALGKSGFLGAIAITDLGLTQMIKKQL